MARTCFDGSEHGHQVKDYRLGFKKNTNIVTTVRMPVRWQKGTGTEPTMPYSMKEYFEVIFIRIVPENVGIASVEFQLFVKAVGKEPLTKVVLDLLLVYNSIVKCRKNWFLSILW